MHTRYGARFFLAAVTAISLLAFSASCAYAQGGIGMSYPEKAKMLEEALQMDPNNTNTLVQLGNTYYDWGFNEVNRKGDKAQPGYYWLKAIQYYRDALKNIPDDANVRTDMSNLLWYTGNIDEAIEGYRAAIKSDPKHVQSRLNLINILAEEKGDFDGAIKEYDKLVKDVPEVANDMSLKQTIDRYRELKEGKGAPSAAPHGTMQQQQEPVPDYEFKR